MNTNNDTRKVKSMESYIFIKYQEVVMMTHSSVYPSFILLSATLSIRLTVHFTLG